MVKTNIQPPSKQDALAILSEAPADQRTLFLLEAMTGLRRGEILALKWRDIDWLNGEVVVERAIKKVKATDGVHKWAYGVGTPKNGKTRRVGSAPIAIEALRVHREISPEVTPEAFIFTRNGTFIDPEHFSKKVALPLVKTVTGGKVKRFHDLRHFFVSMLIDQGETAKYIQDQVGHHSASFTLDVYGHLMPQATREASARLEKALFGGEDETAPDDRTQTRPAVN